MIGEETREGSPSTFAEFPPTPVLSSHEMFRNNHVRLLRLTLPFEYLLEQLKILLGSAPTHFLTQPMDSWTVNYLIW